MSSAPKPFRDVTRRTQIERMRRAARLSLAEYGIDDADLKLLVHDFNTTFRVDDAAGGRRAIRMSLNSQKTPAEVLGEVAWVAALDEETDVLVPTPQRTRSDELATASDVVGMDAPSPTVLYSWLDGPDVGSNPTHRDVAAIGALTAAIHDHGSTWTPPAGPAYRDIGTVMMGSSDVLTGRDLPWTDDAGTATIAAALAETKRVLAPVFAAPQQLIHGDVHMWNVKRSGDRLAVFDFDDCGVGVPFQDLAISAYYFVDRPALRDSLLEGYATVRTVPDHTPEQFEALLASRNLLLLNDVSDSVTAGMDEFLQGYGARTVSRMQRYLDTGVFAFET